MENATNLIQAQTALMAGAGMPSIAGAVTPEKARQVSEEFEAVFLSQMLKPMFANSDAEAPFGGGFAEEMWRSLQVDEYGKAMARAGGVGIADAVMQEILRNQEVDQ